MLILRAPLVYFREIPVSYTDHRTPRRVLKMQCRAAARHAAIGVFLPISGPSPPPQTQNYTGFPARHNQSPQKKMPERLLLPKIRLLRIAFADTDTLTQSIIDVEHTRFIACPDSCRILDILLLPRCAADWHYDGHAHIYHCQVVKTARQLRKLKNITCDGAAHQFYVVTLAAGFHVR